MIDDLQEFRIPDFSNPPYIYFLLKKKKIVYIGQTETMLARISQHRRNKRFDKVLFIPVRREIINASEIYLIKRAKPKYNRMHRRVAKRQPVSWDRKLNYETIRCNEKKAKRLDRNGITTILSLGLNKRATNALLSAGVVRVSHLCRLTPDDLLCSASVGWQTLISIQDCLNFAGLSLRGAEWLRR